MPTIHRLPAAERRQALEAFAGDLVVVEVARYRSSDELEPVVGVLVGVAAPLTGAQALEAVLRTRDGLVTVSLATVATVTRVSGATHAQRAAERRTLVDHAQERAAVARELRTVARLGELADQAVRIT